MGSLPSPPSVFLQHRQRHTVQREHDAGKSIIEQFAEPIHLTGYPISPQSSSSTEAVICAAVPNARHTVRSGNSSVVVLSRHVTAREPVEQRLVGAVVPGGEQLAEGSAVGELPSSALVSVRSARSLGKPARRSRSAISGSMAPRRQMVSCPVSAGPTCGLGRLAVACAF